MNNLEINISGNNLIISHSGHEYYSIRIDFLDEKSSDNTSEWIMQLMDKTWVSNDLLYRIAQFVDKKHPDNSIDWKATFFIVEKAAFLNSMSGILTEKKSTITEELIEQVQLGIKETNDENHKIIEQIMNKRLMEYDLL